MEVQLVEPYEPRRISYLGTWAEAGWRIKAYGIGYRRERPRPELIDAARRVAVERLPQPAAGEGRYGAAFVGVHDGRGANFVFVDWWADENELHHHVYVSPADRPAELQYKTPTGLFACVWDLAVLSFERQAWIECVLSRESGPDVESYLRKHLNVTV